MMSEPVTAEELAAIVANVETIVMRVHLGELDRPEVLERLHQWRLHMERTIRDNPELAPYQIENEIALVGVLKACASILEESRA
jgi:hypothetical protein